MREKFWDKIPPKNLTADGGASGEVEVTDALQFHVKQQVILRIPGTDLSEVEVKQIPSQTELLVGPKGDISKRSTLTLFTVAAGATIEAVDQNRPAIPDKEYERASFEEEPVVAKRVIQVDRLGVKHSPTNPIPSGIYGNDPEGTRIGNIGNSLKVASDSATPMIIAPANNLTDSFGRMRVSNPRNLFEWQFRYSPSISIYWDSTNVNGATQGLDLIEVGYRLNGAAQVGSRAIMQSRRNIEYVPGKSQQIFLTGNFEGLDSSWTKRYGAFDENNGLFFQMQGNTPQVVIRSSTTGSVVNDAVDRVDWNGDSLDGTGLSGETLDLTKQQLFFIDYAYLGTGDVRFGIFINGNFIIIHTFHNENKNDSSYMQSGILPIRLEVEAIGTPLTTTSMKASCVSVASEGAATELGRIRSGNTGTNASSFNVNETFIFGIRINPLYPYSSVAGIFFELLASSGNSNALWKVYYNPTLAGPTWADVPDSIVQAVSNVPVVTGGVLIASGYLSLANSATLPSTQLLLTDIFLGRSIAGIPDTLVITMQSTQGNGSAFFAGQWKEIS